MLLIGRDLTFKLFTNPLELLMISYGLNTGPARPKTRLIRINAFIAFNRWQHELFTYCQYWVRVRVFCLLFFLSRHLEYRHLCYMIKHQ